jgi:hypothetical protein
MKNLATCDIKAVAASDRPVSVCLRPCVHRQFAEDRPFWLFGEHKGRDHKSELSFSSSKLETMGQERLNVVHGQNTAVRHAWWQEDEINK